MLFCVATCRKKKLFKSKRCRTKCIVLYSVRCYLCKQLTCDSLQFKTTFRLVYNLQKLACYIWCELLCREEQNNNAILFKILSCMAYINYTANEIIILIVPQLQICNKNIQFYLYFNTSIVIASQNFRSITRNVSE